MTTKPAFVPVAVTSALISTLRSATSSSLLSDDQAVASLMNISPLPVPEKRLVLIVILLEFSQPDSCAPVISPPEAATIKSAGSSNHVPAVPLSDNVVTRALLPICKCAAEVSTKPPVPLPIAVAEALPLKVVSPSAHMMILPPSALLPVPSALSVVSSSIRSVCTFCTSSSLRYLPP